MALCESDLDLMVASPQGSMLSSDSDDLMQRCEGDDLPEAACPLDGLDGSAQRSAQRRPSTPPPSGSDDEASDLMEALSNGNVSDVMEADSGSHILGDLSSAGDALPAAHPGPFYWAF